MTIVKNYFTDSLNFKTVGFNNAEHMQSLLNKHLETRDQLNMSATIAQLDLIILHKLNEKGYGNENILVPGLEFTNESMLCIRREELIEAYKERGVDMEFVFAGIEEQAGKFPEVKYFRFGVNIDVTFYIKFKLQN